MDAQKEFIEKFAICFQETGWAKMDGRIIAWLLICDPPHQNLKTLVKEIQASKSTLSVTIRKLIRSGWVERIGLPGDRCDYFRLKDDFYSSSIEFFTNRMMRLAELTKEGLKLMDSSSPEQLRRLQKASKVFSFIGEEMLEFIKVGMDESLLADRIVPKVDT